MKSILLLGKYFVTGLPSVLNSKKGLFHFSGRGRRGVVSCCQYHHSSILASGPGPFLVNPANRIKLNMFYSTSVNVKQKRYFKAYASWTVFLPKRFKVLIWKFGRKCVVFSVQLTLAWRSSCLPSLYLDQTVPHPAVLSRTAPKRVRRETRTTFTGGWRDLASSFTGRAGNNDTGVPWNPVAAEKRGLTASVAWVN